MADSKDERAVEPLIIKKHEWGASLVIDVELHMSWVCGEEEDKASAKGEDYACKCEDPFQWSLEKLLDYAEKYFSSVDYSEAKGPRNTPSDSE